MCGAVVIHILRWCGAPLIKHTPNKKHQQQLGSCVGTITTADQQRTLRCADQSNWILFAVADTRPLSCFVDKIGPHSFAHNKQQTHRPKQGTGTRARVTLSIFQVLPYREPSSAAPCATHSTYIFHTFVHTAIEEEQHHDNL